MNAFHLFQRLLYHMIITVLLTKNIFAKKYQHGCIAILSRLHLPAPERHLSAVVTGLHRGLEFGLGVHPVDNSRFMTPKERRYLLIGRT